LSGSSRPQWLFCSNNPHAEFGSSVYNKYGASTVIPRKAALIRHISRAYSFTRGAQPNRRISPEACRPRILIFPYHGLYFAIHSEKACRTSSKDSTDKNWGSAVHAILLEFIGPERIQLQSCKTKVTYAATAAKGGKLRVGEATGGPAELFSFHGPQSIERAKEAQLSFGRRRGKRSQMRNLPELA
jgi:hypothetical protein